MARVHCLCFVRHHAAACVHVMGGDSLSEPQHVQLWRNAEHHKLKQQVPQRPLLLLPLLPGCVLPGQHAWCLRLC
jgi:hypothetical protein